MVQQVLLGLARIDIDGWIETETETKAKTKTKTDRSVLVCILMVASLSLSLSLCVWVCALVAVNCRRNPDSQMNGWVYAMLCYAMLCHAVVWCGVVGVVFAMNSKRNPENSQCRHHCTSMPWHDSMASLASLASSSKQQHMMWYQAGMLHVPCCMLHAEKCALLYCIVLYCIVLYCCPVVVVHHHHHHHHHHSICSNHLVLSCSVWKCVFMLWLMPCYLELGVWLWLCDVMWWQIPSALNYITSQHSTAQHSTAQHSTLRVAMVSG